MMGNRKSFAGLYLKESVQGKKLEATNQKGDKVVVREDGSILCKNSQGVTISAANLMFMHHDKGTADRAKMLKSAVSGAKSSKELASALTNVTKTQWN